MHTAPTKRKGARGMTRPVLRRGSEGPAVAELQRSLGEARIAPGPADGIFGSVTDAAVRRFQAREGLTVDGVVGPKTWRALLADLCRHELRPDECAARCECGHRCPAHGDGEATRCTVGGCPCAAWSPAGRVAISALPPRLTWGVDVSSAGQARPLPWSSLYDAGARFAWVRVLHGVTPDSWAVQHAADALHAGILVGAYGVLTTFDPGLAWQCGEDLAIRARSLGAVDLPLALDLELPPVKILAQYAAADILALLDAARAFCERAEEIADRRCVVYAGPAWLATAAQRTGAAGRKKLVALADRRPLWLAHYGLDLAGWPATPEPWTDASIWQAAGDDGKLRVDDHSIDLNLFRGDDPRRLGR